MKKLRRGGVLTPEFMRRAVESGPAGLRPLVRQAMGANTLDLRTGPLSVRAAANGTGGTRLVFEGAFTKLDFPYEMPDWLGTYNEIMHLGSLDRTLNAGADVKFVLNHEWDHAPMARTTAGSLDCNPDGTMVARIDGSRSDVAIVASAVEGGELNAMSFAFWVVRQLWSPDYDQRDIYEVDMDGGDVSVVTHPANPGTEGTVGMRKRAGRSLLRSGILPVLVDAARRERRADDTLSDATREILQTVLDLVAAADVAVDAAQPLLAELLGVANPDEDAPDDEPDGDEGRSGVNPQADCNCGCGCDCPCTGDGCACVDGCGCECACWQRSAPAVTPMTRSRLRLLEDPAVRRTA